MTQRYLELQRGQAEVRAQKSQQRYVNCKKKTLAIQESPFI